MKKIFALLVLVALLFCITACSRDDKEDLSAQETYTSGELRKMADEAMHEAASRISELGASFAETFVEIMQENGYQMEYKNSSNARYDFTDLNNPSFEMYYMYNTACGGHIYGDISGAQLRDYFCGLLKAIAHVEEHPDEQTIEDYGYDLDNDIPFENLQPEVRYDALLDGYRCRIVYHPATEDEEASYFFYMIQ